LGQYDLPEDVDDGLYMVGDDEDFGKNYDIRAISDYLKRIAAPWDYAMSEAEMEQFRRKPPTTNVA
jgi:hypothetical protein